MRPTRLRRSRIAEINVVPYIDVMLVLLVIFMVTAPLLTQGVQVNLPEASAKAIDDSDETPVVVSVDEKGLFYLNVVEHPSEAMSASAIASRVAAELEYAKRQGKHRQVLVRGDRHVPYEKVMDAMVLLQHSGALSVGLITEPGSSLSDDGSHQRV